MGIECPICESTDLKSLPARIAPFISARSGLLSTERARNEILPASSNLCQICHHLFFTPFMDENQLSRIYSGYRGPEYTAMRVSFEPGYAEVAQAFSDPASQLEEDRTTFYKEMFPHWEFRTGNVVDFGGADGHFSKFLMPNASVTIVDEGFERGGGDLNGLINSADFIVAQHAFEHIPQPTAQLKRIASGMKSGAEIFIELPKEYTGSTLSHFSTISSALDAGAPLPWDGFTTLHEHIQHFSIASMRRLVVEAELQIVETCQARMTGMTTMAVVGRKL